MTDLKHLRVEKVEGTARITLARPKHNVLNIEMMKEMIAQLELIAADCRW